MDWLSYAFNFVPWWAWVAGGVVLVAVFWQPVFAFWVAAPKWLRTTIVSAGALLAVYVAGRNKGSKDERDRRAKADARAVQTRKETDDEVRNLPADNLDRRLGRWMRD